jgi:hypothetical protein
MEYIIRKGKKYWLTDAGFPSKRRFAWIDDFNNVARFATASRFQTEYQARHTAITFGYGICTCTASIAA